MAAALVDFQRRMAADVMRPLTADEDMQAVLPDGRATANAVAQYVKPNSRLTAFERLELYNRQYWYRVIGAFQEDFPALAAVIGPRRFDALTAAYLQAHPSRSFTLRNLGGKLVDWLRENPEYAGRRHALALDTARLEWAYVEAFDAAELPVLTKEQVAGLNEESKLRLQPHLQLLEFQYPVDDFVIAVHKGRVRSEAASQAVHEVVRETAQAKTAARRKKNWLAVHRYDLSVYYRRLDAREFRVLRALQAGGPLGFALAGAKPEQVAEWFHSWAEFGWLCAE